MIKRIEDCLPA
jgi:tubulin polyglutamylase TTLL5